MSRPVWLLTIIVIGCVLLSCSSEDDTEQQVVRISVLPDQEETRLRKRFEPLIAYLSETLSMRVELFIPESYADQLQRFYNGEYDIARFGGFSFVKANEKTGAVPIVMRDIDTRFASYFLVGADNPASKISDMKGQRFSFGSKSSTSGHLMPRYFLMKQNIATEEYFSQVQYSGAHDRTAYLVRDGKADLGVANAIVIDRLYKEGKLNKDQVRILWKTPPYADYVWAASAKLPKQLRLQIQNAFMDLSKNVPEQAQILQALEAGVYLPASPEDFASLKQISHELRLLDDE